jgi:hypothetical protein
MENFETGDIVMARFTNCGHFHEFRGEVVGRTKNYWKVKCLENFRRSSLGAKEVCEEIGRVFQIATMESRTYSANNCIREKVAAEA